jgi:hypothetical protein
MQGAVLEKGSPLFAESEVIKLQPWSVTGATSFKVTPVQA